MSAKKLDPVATLLSRAIAVSGKTQREIAQEAGFPKPNVVSMMASGVTKVPLSRIPKLAEACGINPTRFLRLALQTYHPEVWAILTMSLGPVLDTRERMLIEGLRTAEYRGEDAQVDAAYEAAMEKILDMAGPAAGSS